MGGHPVGTHPWTGDSFIRLVPNHVEEVVYEEEQPVSTFNCHTGSDDEED